MQNTYQSHIGVGRNPIDFNWFSLCFNVDICNRKIINSTIEPHSTKNKLQLRIHRWKTMNLSPYFITLHRFLLCNIATYMLASTSLDLIFQIGPIQTGRHRRTHVDRDGIYTRDTLSARNANPGRCTRHNYCMVRQHQIHGPICHERVHDGSPISLAILEPPNLCLLSFW